MSGRDFNEDDAAADRYDERMEDSRANAEDPGEEEIEDLVERAEQKRDFQRDCMPPPHRWAP